MSRERREFLWKQCRGYTPSLIRIVNYISRASADCQVPGKPFPDDDNVPDNYLAAVVSAPDLGESASRRAMVASRLATTDGVGGGDPGKGGGGWRA